MNFKAFQNIHYPFRRFILDIHSKTELAVLNKRDKTTIMLYNLFKIFPLWFLIISMGALSGCASQKTGGSQGEDQPLSNHLLWEISGNGLEQSSFLFGTIHLIGSDDFFWPSGTLSAFDKSKKVVFEIDMAEISDISSQFGMLQKAFMRDNISLRDLLSDEDYKIVEDHFSAIGLPLFMLERMKPMFLTILTGGDMGGLDMNLFSPGGNTKSYEIELNSMAEASGKPVSGLETVEFQMSLFDSIPYEIQARMLVDAIENPESVEGNGGFDEIVALYRNQDIEGMATLVKEDDSGFGEFTDLILKNRNIAWIAPMEAMMKDQRVFFAVGAGHLGGEMGVIRLLKQKGFTVAPYNP